MSLDGIATLNKKDVERLRQFKNLIQHGDFELKGNAVLKAAELFMWFNSLETKFEHHIAKNGAPKIKEDK